MSYWLTRDKTTDSIVYCFWEEEPELNEKGMWKNGGTVILMDFIHPDFFENLFNVKLEPGEGIKIIGINIVFGRWLQNECCDLVPK